jgi:hypothetical protein
MAVRLVRFHGALSRLAARRAEIANGRTVFWFRTLFISANSRRHEGGIECQALARDSIASRAAYRIEVPERACGR